MNGFAVGGGEVKLLELVRKLHCQHGHRFYGIVCSVGQGGPLREQFERLGVKTLVYRKKGKYDISLIWKVARLMRDERVDIVQTTLFYADVIGTLAARLVGMNNIVSWEAITQPYGFKHLMAYRFASKFYRFSVAVSYAIQKRIIEERHVFPQKTMTIQYGVDTEKFYPVRGRTIRDELGIKKKARVLGTVARFTQQKGHQYLIDAAPKIMSAFPDVYFVFVGDGPLRPVLQSRVHQLGLDSQVLFLGFRSDIRDLLNAFDVFVLPSLYEGLPNVVLEAMACGKPVIATEVDGTPEAVVQGRTGILVPPQDSEALGNAIIELLGDKRKVEEMGDRGRERVEKKFSLDGEINKFVELYERL